MSTPSVPNDRPQGGREESSLRVMLQAPSLPQALRIAAELRKVADRAKVYSRASSVAGRPDWFVSLTTAPLPLTLEVVRRWEARMLAAERRWPGCRFLGWTTSCGPLASTRPAGETAGHDADAMSQRCSQRELVVASLLRCPSIERRGIAVARVGNR